jgi:hypothetical protein
MLKICINLDPKSDSQQEMPSSPNVFSYTDQTTQSSVLNPQPKPNKTI